MRLAVPGLHVVFTGSRIGRTSMEFGISVEELTDWLRGIGTANPLDNFTGVMYVLCIASSIPRIGGFNIGSVAFFPAYNAWKYEVQSSAVQTDPASLLSSYALPVISSLGLFSGCLNEVVARPSSSLDWLSVLLCYTHRSLRFDFSACKHSIFFFVFVLYTSRKLHSFSLL